MKCYAFGEMGCPVLRLSSGAYCPGQANPGAVMRCCGVRNDGRVPGDERTGEVKA